MQNHSSTGATALATLAISLVAFAVQAQTTLPATHALPSTAADSSKPGFIWNISQVAATEPDQLAWAEDQLSGLHGVNLADPNATGVAGGPANPANPATAPISFEIPDIINLSKAAGTSKGNFTPDLQMPGLPGTDLTTRDGGTGNAAAELLTYLDLPVGTILLGVNSDDGFRMTIGGAIPADKFSLNVGQFDGGRGAANTIFPVTVTKAGLYAARVLWETGGGDANIELFSLPNGTTPVLVNDLANGGIKAYRAVTTALPAYAQKLVPAPGQTGLLPLTPVQVELVDGPSPINTNSVSLQVDGAGVAATITKTTNVTVTSYQISNLTPFTPGQHTAAFIYTEGTTRITNTWSFTVQKYITLDPTWRVASGDTNKPGFLFNYYANSYAENLATTLARAEADLALPVYGGDFPLPNLADPNIRGAATGRAEPASPENAPLHFEIAGVINLSGEGVAGTNGNFKPDQQMPGVPSIDNTWDGSAAEIITYLTLPAGAVEMGVNSDDGFSTASGPNVQDAFGRVVLGAFDGARGASDTLFVFYVPQAGTYPFRTVWVNGTGGANIEWFTVKPDGTKVLLNDVANGGFPGYRAALPAPVAVPTVKVISPPTLLLPRQLLNFATNLNFTLADGATPVDNNSVTLQINGKNIPLTKTRNGSYLNVVADVSADLHIPGDLAVLKFNDTGSYSRTQSWTLYNLVNLVFPPTPVTGENFDSYPESSSTANTVPPGWVASNFTYHETPGWDLADLASDAYIDWVIIDAARAAGHENFQNDTSQVINGQPIAGWVSGNVLFSSSDSRAGGGLPQVRQAISKPFDLSSVTNPVLSFYSNLRISGNRTEGMFLEYSIDGGHNWLPAAYYQRDGVTLALNLDGSYDAVACFDTPGSIITRWTDPILGPRGGKLGDYLLAPLSQALAPYIVERRDAASSRRVEAVRLAKASKQKDVRLRFAHIGSCGWYWGVDNIAFYDITGPPQAPALSIAHGPNSVTITFEGSLEQADSPTGTWSPVSGGSPQTINNPTGTKFYRAVNP